MTRFRAGLSVSVNQYCFNYLVGINRVFYPSVFSTQAGFYLDGFGGDSWEENVSSRENGWFWSKRKLNHCLPNITFGKQQKTKQKNLFTWLWIFSPGPKVKALLISTSYLAWIVGFRRSCTYFDTIPLGQSLNVCYWEPKYLLTSGTD